MPYRYGLHWSHRSGSMAAGVWGSIPKLWPAGAEVGCGKRPGTNEYGGNGWSGKRRRIGGECIIISCGSNRNLGLTPHASLAKVPPTLVDQPASSQMASDRSKGKTEAAFITHGAEENGTMGFKSWMNLSGLLLASAVLVGCNGPDKREPQPTYRPGTTTIGQGPGQPPVFPRIGGPGSMNAGGAAGAPQGQGGM